MPSFDTEETIRTVLRESTAMQRSHLLAAESSDGSQLNGVSNKDIYDFSNEASVGLLPSNSMIGNSVGSPAKPPCLIVERHGINGWRSSYAFDNSTTRFNTECRLGEKARWVGQCAYFRDGCISIVTHLPPEGSIDFTGFPNAVTTACVSYPSQVAWAPAYTWDRTNSSTRLSTAGTLGGRRTSYRSNGNNKASTTASSTVAITSLAYASASYKSSQENSTSITNLPNENTSTSFPSGPNASTSYVLSGPSAFASNQLSGRSTSYRSGAAHTLGTSRHSGGTSKSCGSSARPTSSTSGGSISAFKASISGGENRTDASDNYDLNCYPDFALLDNILKSLYNELVRNVNLPSVRGETNESDNTTSTDDSSTDSGTDSSTDSGRDKSSNQENDDSNNLPVGNQNRSPFDVINDLEVSDDSENTEEIIKMMPY